MILLTKGDRRVNDSITKYDGSQGSCWKSWQCLYFLKQICMDTKNYWKDKEKEEKKSKIYGKWFYFVPDSDIEGKGLGSLPNSEMKNVAP